MKPVRRLLLCQQADKETRRAKARQHFVAAPVFGRPDIAAAGELAVVARQVPLLAR